MSSAILAAVRPSSFGIVVYKLLTFIVTSRQFQFCDKLPRPWIISRKCVVSLTNDGKGQVGRIEEKINELRDALFGTDVY